MARKDTGTWNKEHGKLKQTVNPRHRNMLDTTPTTERIEEVRLRIASACARAGRRPEQVTLIAITKGFPASAVREAAGCGLRDFGENRLQEAQTKLAELADLTSVTWHMVGHLQTNKVKNVLRRFDIIHSVDSLHLAQEISRRAPHTVPAFLEVNVAGEPSKHGFSLARLPEAYEAIATLPELEVRGLMTVAPAVADAEEVRPVFRRLREAADRLGLSQLSMGMTDDFEVAIEEGATHIRVGRAIFGERG
jgi:pyridoxal phosphate enzyme (YggS family)